MKGRTYLIIGLLAGGVCGWALGFLRLPLIEKNDSFWIGLLAGICLVAMVMVIRSTFGKKAKVGPAFSKRAWIGGIAIFLVSGGLLSFLLLDNTNEEFHEQLVQKKTEFLQEQALINARQQANLGLVMGELFDQIQEEVNTQNGKVSASTIGEIARISQSFEPYAYFNEDSLTRQKLSPERGQLLLFLISTKMDSSSFQRVLAEATFAGADLEGTDLAGLELSGINLMGANLKDAFLNDINLSESELRGADFRGARLQRADLSGVDMRRADVRWANLEKGILRKAYLDGANFSDALMREVDMAEATFQFGTLNGAMLYKANLWKADFLKTDMIKVDLTQANLSMANLQRTDLTDASFVEANLLGVAVQEENWIEKLATWKVAGREAITTQNLVVKDTARRYHDVHFLLIPRED